jgi:amino acid transporter
MRRQTLTIVSTFVQFSGWSVFLKNNWDTATFVTNYFPFVLSPILYLGAKWWKGTPVIGAAEMDFQSGLAEIEADTFDEPPPKNKMEAFWQWLVCLFHFIENNYFLI